MDNNKKIKILVLCAGGCKGYLQANVLKHLELKTGKRIHELFDLIVGTSTGGILTYGVTCGDYDADTIIRLYETEGANIFQKRFLSFFNSKFKLDGLVNTLNKYFKGFKLSDCKVKTITTGRDKLNKKNMIFKSWSDYWKDLDVLHAVVSTAAAAFAHGPRGFSTQWNLHRHREAGGSSPAHQRSVLSSPCRASSTSSAALRCRTASHAISQIGLPAH